MVQATPSVPIKKFGKLHIDDEQRITNIGRKSNSSSPKKPDLPKRPFEDRPKLPYRRPRTETTSSLRSLKENSNISQGTVSDAVVFTGMRSLSRAQLLNFNSEFGPRGIVYDEDVGKCALYGLHNGRLCLFDGQDGRQLSTAFLNGTTINAVIDCHNGILLVTDGGRKLHQLAVPWGFSEGSINRIVPNAQLPILNAAKLVRRPGRREIWLNGIGDSLNLSILTWDDTGSTDILQDQIALQSLSSYFFIDENDLAVIETEKISLYTLNPKQTGSKGMALTTVIPINVVDSPILKIFKRGEAIIIFYADGKAINCRLGVDGEVLSKTVFIVTRYKVACVLEVFGRFWLGLQIGKCLIVQFDSDSRGACGGIICKTIIELRHSQDTPITGLLNTGPLVWSVCSAGRLCCWDGTLALYQSNQTVWANRARFAQKTTLRLRIASWNVAAQGPSSEKSPTVWQDWLGSGDDCDLIVIGLQEIQDLKSTSAKAGVLDEWIGVIQRLDPRLILLHSSTLVGLGLIVFARRGKLLPDISSVHGTFVKTGLGGLHGNKGALVVRMLLGSTPIAFVQAHLPAGHKAVNERNSDAAIIVRTADLPSVKHSISQLWPFFPGSGNQGQRILDHEIVWLFGDLNYRIELPRAQCEQALNDLNMSVLHGSDQLRKQLSNHNQILSEFRECFESGPSFAPTYKYDIGSLNRFDSSEKQRVPAWCDRILHFYNGESAPIRSLSYTSIMEAVASDHKPIYAVYEVDYWKVDEQRQVLFLQELFQKDAKSFEIIMKQSWCHRDS